MPAADDLPVNGEGLNQEDILTLGCMPSLGAKSVSCLDSLVVPFLGHFQDGCLVTWTDAACSDPDVFIISRAGFGLFYCDGSPWRVTNKAVIEGSSPEGCSSDVIILVHFQYFYKNNKTPLFFPIFFSPRREL